jgi:hypothetical protein
MGLYRSAFKLFYGKVGKEEYSQYHEPHSRFTEDAAIEKSTRTETVCGASHKNHQHVDCKNGSRKKEAEIDQ